MSKRNKNDPEVGKHRDGPGKADLSIQGKHGVLPPEKRKVTIRDTWADAYYGFLGSVRSFFRYKLPRWYRKIRRKF